MSKQTNNAEPPTNSQTTTPPATQRLNDINAIVGVVEGMLKTFGPLIQSATSPVTVATLDTTSNENSPDMPRTPSNTPVDNNTSNIPPPLDFATLLKNIGPLLSNNRATNSQTDSTTGGVSSEKTQRNEADQRDQRDQRTSVDRLRTYLTNPSFSEITMDPKMLCSIVEGIPEKFAVVLSDNKTAMDIVVENNKSLVLREILKRPEWCNRLDLMEHFSKVCNNWGESIDMVREFCGANWDLHDTKVYFPSDSCTRKIFDNHFNYIPFSPSFIENLPKSQLRLFAENYVDLFC